VGATIIALSCLAALLASVIAPYAPTKMSFGSELVPPSTSFPFGTDDLGRDIFSRVLYGIRSSFAVVVPAVALAALVGVGTGMALGYYGGLLDIVVMRAYDMLMAFPALLLAIVMIAFLGPSYLNLVLSLALLSLSGFAVLTRSATLSARSSEYVQAAVALGAGSGRIMIVHLLRNLAPVITTQAALTLSILILVEASLAFLGIGVQPPTPSLGGMLNAAQTYMTIAPWLALAPGLTIMVVVVGFNLLADGIRDLQGRPTG
jgi:ABC-type dipeptide/oligopeptide/nickel transport system permease subunit